MQTLNSGSSLPNQDPNGLTPDPKFAIGSRKYSAREMPRLRDRPRDLAKMA